MAAALPKHCANCWMPMPKRANSGTRGRDIAWMVHCRDCAALVAKSMTLAFHEPTGARIDLWQCNHCGEMRACRPGWLTRCPVCLDERTVLDDETRSQFRALLDAKTPFKALVAEVMEVPRRQVTVEDAVMVENVLLIGEYEESYKRPGWTLLASDLCGTPWPYGIDTRRSHGTWAKHDVCGTVQNVTLARPECRVCPPEPESRTHRAKAEQPQYLYLVRYLDLLKFGHGDANRIRAHRRAGCEVVQVLRAPHAQVVAAELQMKRHYRAHLIDPLDWHMPITFGTGSEVVPDDVPISLAAFLEGRGVSDESHRWS